MDKVSTAQPSRTEKGASAHLIEEQQQELFNYRYENTQLLYVIARLLAGTEKEQREAIRDVTELVKEPLIARRVVRLLDHDDHLRSRAPELYERAKRYCMP
ncbi:MAG: hypothetical protein ACREPQ_14565 [Rhodanobacter sp.]